MRSFARRHVDVLLARGTTWSNVDGALRLLAEDSEQQIVFGPWRGDAALELLYWAPFVRWAQRHFSLDPARIVVVSRAGVGHWYEGVCGTYADAPDDLRSAFPAASLFPPEPVLALVEAYRSGSAAARPLLKRTDHALLPPPPGTDAADLRDDYVAVSVAPTPAFPASPANEAAADRLLASLSASSRVVSLDQVGGLRERHALLARARGLVAAYSGLAVLGALSGVPVIALRSPEGEVAEPDLDLAQRVVSALGGSLTVLDAADLESLEAALGGSVSGR